jgi:hypothetical protein
MAAAVASPRRPATSATPTIATTNEARTTHLRVIGQALVSTLSLDSTGSDKRPPMYPSTLVSVKCRELQRRPPTSEGL